MANTNQTTNLPNGVTNVLDAQQNTLGSLPFPDPGRCHTWFDDFDDYSALEWVITETGTGTRAVGNLDGGILVITNDTHDNDVNTLQWSGLTNASVVETWLWESGRGMWFKARMKVSDATQSDLVFGLVTTNTTPITSIVDGLYFLKVDGSTTLNMLCTKNSTSTTLTAGTLVSDTYFTAGFWWNQDLGELTVYFNNQPVASTLTTSNFPDDEELTITFGIQNGDGNARVLSLDYLTVSKDRHQTVA